MAWIISQALMKDYENSHCLPGQAVEYLEDTCSDGEQSVQSKSNPIPHVYLPKDKMTAFSRLSRFGMIFAHLTEIRGEELLMWFRAGFPVRTSVVQEKEKDSMENVAGSGLKCSEWFAKLDPDMCSWKTPQCSLFEDLEQSLETWPRWGTMRNGVCWEGKRQDCVLIEEDVGFSLMRPIATDGMRQTLQIKSLVRNGHQDGNLTEQLARVKGKKLTPLCGEILMNWPEEWTGLKPLEMDKFQQWQNSHGKY